MKVYPLFLSLVIVTRNQVQELEKILLETTAFLFPLVQDYELIIVDNASQDESLFLLKKLTEENGLPNLQVYALNSEVDFHTASWAGIENALGDVVVSIDPASEDVHFLPTILEKAVEGADIVFAKNRQKPTQTLSYRVGSLAFRFFSKYFHGLFFIEEVPRYCLLNKKVIHFILQHPQPSLTYRSLPAIAGFVRVYLDYRASIKICIQKRLRASLDRSIQLLVSTTRTPMRIVTSLSLFGAIVNLLYSFVILGIRVFKAEVTPGWTSISLQQSGMFFLISSVLFMLGEYLLHLESLSNTRPQYNISKELTSVHMTHREKLNLEHLVYPKTTNLSTASDLKTVTSLDHKEQPSCPT